MEWEDEAINGGALARDLRLCAFWMLFAAGAWRGSDRWRLIWRSRDCRVQRCGVLEGSCSCERGLDWEMLPEKGRWGTGARELWKAVDASRDAGERDRVAVGFSLWAWTIYISFVEDNFDSWATTKEYPI